MNVYITQCDYTLITIPEKYDKDIRMPSDSSEHRRALGYIKKYQLNNEILTIDLDTNKPYRNPNVNTVVFRQAQRNGIKIEGMILYIRDVNVIRKISKPNKKAL